MKKAVLFFGLSAVVALTGAVAACSSTTVTSVDTSPEGGTAEGGAKDSGGGQDSSPIDTDTGTTSDPDQACAAMATLTTCGQCCATNHAAGYKVFQDSLIGCTCKGTGADGGVGPCATQCATTICAATPASPDATCNMCLQTAVGSGGSCNMQVGSDCTAAPDCLAQQKCIAPCQGKPAM